MDLSRSPFKPAHPSNSGADEVTFETFELEADAWDFLYDGGFVARLDNHREFDHTDGRYAVLIPGVEHDPETEVKIFRSRRR